MDPITIISSLLPISIIQTTVIDYSNKSIKRIVMDFLSFSFAFEIGMNM